MDTDIQIRCEDCLDWAEGATNDRHLECDCGTRYTISVTTVDVQR